MDRTIRAVFPDTGADHEICRADQAAAIDHITGMQANALQFQIEGEWN